MWSGPAPCRPIWKRRLKPDGRAGAQAILAAVERRRHANRAEGQRLRTMLRYETQLWESGVLQVAGIDEAGMSPLAGPVAAAAAVILRPGTRIPGVDDCKKLDARERERLAPLIMQEAIAWAVAFAEPEEIDRLNIYWAGIAAMKRALAALAPGARAPADRRPPAEGRAHPPAGHRRRRQQEPDHRRRLDPGQDRARRAHARAGRRVSRLRLRQAQGVSGEGPLRRAEEAGRLRHPPALVRARAHRPGAADRAQLAAAGAGRTRRAERAGSSESEL